MAQFDKFSVYENWVDKLINTHKTRLEGLRSGKTFCHNSTAFNFSSPCRNNDSSEDTTINRYRTSSKDCKENDILYDKFKQEKNDKLVQSLIEENAQLKVKLQDKEKIINNIKDNFSLHEKDFNRNSSLFFEREKDLVETLKLLDFDNKRLEEKVNEMKLELSRKTRELDLARTENSLKLSSHLIINSPITNKNNDEDLQLLCLKFDKIIEIFIMFFEKFEFTAGNNNINSYVKNFDYENLRLKLVEFENYFKNKPTISDAIKNNFNYSESNELTPRSQNNFNSITTCNNYQNNKSRNINESLPEKYSEENMTGKQTIQSNSCVGETETISKLEKRLRELENNVSNLVNNKGIKCKNANDTTTNTSRVNMSRSKSNMKDKNKVTINTSSSTSNLNRSQNLKNNIKQTKINISKINLSNDNSKAFSAISKK